MNITTGTGGITWKPKRIKVTDAQTVNVGSTVPSGQLTFGPLGACQGGQLGLVTLPGAWAGQARRHLLRTRLESEQGEGALHAGILDQAVATLGGGLRNLNMLPPHEAFIDVPNMPLGGVGWITGTRLYGIPGPSMATGETLKSAMEKLLEPFPNSEVGVGPDLAVVAGRPENAAPAVYSFDRRAQNFVNKGLNIPNYVTDAVFDPGDGWPVTVYSRNPPNYIVRRTASATADPAIATREDKTIVPTRNGDPIPSAEIAPPPSGETTPVMHAFNNVIEVDNVERTYAEGDSTKLQILSDVGLFTFTTPADTAVRRNKKIRIRCPFFISGIAPYPPFARVVYNPLPVNGGATLTPVGGTVVIGTLVTDSLGAPPPPLGSSPTLEQIAAKVNEQNTYLQSLKDQNNTTSSTLNSAKTDLSNLAQRVNQLSSNTTDSSGTLVNLADELKAVQEKLNGLGSDVARMDTASRTPRNTPRKGELKLQVTISVNGQPLKTSIQTIKEQDIALELAFQFEVDKIEAGVNVELRYDLTEQDTGKSITMTFRPIEVVVDYETPNVEGVVMPDGWDAPYQVGPSCEFDLPGCVAVPPLRIDNIPGIGTQYAAGTVVTWSPDRGFNTHVVTEAWPFPGQRRNS